MIAGFTMKFDAVNLTSADTAREVGAGDGMLVEWFSHVARGGPETAKATMKGDVVTLTQYLILLRSPVTIYSPFGIKVWWGYLHEMTLKIGALEITVSLDEMYNRVWVIYNRVDPGRSGVGTQVTTAYAEDTHSQSVYGIKELKQTLADAFDTQAISARDAILEISKYPQSGLDITDADGNENMGEITFMCKGWWDTLEWRYYSNTAGYIGYTDAGAGDRPVGAGDSVPKVAQSITWTGTENWSPYSIRVKVGKNNAPTDDFVVELCADSAGAPGSVLASKTVNNSLLTSTVDWYEFVLTSNPSLVPGTTYWIQCRRSGADDATHYYVVDVNESLGYAGGIFRCWNGSSWIVRPGADADMNFEVLGIQETTAQISSIVKASGQFILAQRYDNSSGVYTSQYRDGTQDAKSYVEALLDAGTSNKKRLLAEVTDARALRIYEETPYSVDAALLVTGHGKIYQGDVAVPKWEVRPGMWIAPKDTIYSFIDGIRLSGFNPMLIERTEYVVSSNSLRLTPRAKRSVWEIANSLAGLG